MYKILFFIMLFSFIYFLKKITDLQSPKETLKDKFLIVLSLLILYFLYLLFKEAFFNGIFIWKNNV